MIEFRQLRYFTLLAETLHYGRTAELLHITQPPLSRQISALEQELGVQLFNRTSRTVQLTQAGEQFYSQAKALLADLEGARRNARATARGDQGELRLSFTMSAAWNLLPRLIKAYTAERPAVQLHLSETLPRDLQSALSSGNTDIGIAFPSHLPRHLRYQALHHEPLCAVLPAEHPLAGEAQIDVARLADEPFISFPASTAPALHEALFRCCREHGFTPLIRLETHLQQTIVNLVSAGLGVALVPDSMRRMQLEGAVLRPLLDSPRIEQGLYWNGDNDNPCLPGFLDCARRLLAQERTV